MKAQPSCAIHVCRLIPLTLAVTLASTSSQAFGAQVEPAPVEVPAAGTARKLGVTVLGGLVVPRCGAQQGCDGDLSVAPSVGALVLYGLNDRWAVGVAAQLSRTHWNETYIGMVDGKTYHIDSDLTTGYAGLAARFVPLPDMRLTPVIQAALGTGLQIETGSNFNCNDGVIPTGQLAIGGRARASASFSFFALASASWGVKLSDCGVSDGPGATPFAGWGFGLHAGAAFDVLLR